MNFLSFFFFKSQENSFGVLFYHRILLEIPLIVFKKKRENLEFPSDFLRKKEKKKNNFHFGKGII
jgi:hypothetical protein